MVMKCPKCESKNTLKWQLTACEFKCNQCGNLVRICDLKNKKVLQKTNQPESKL